MTDSNEIIEPRSEILRRKRVELGYTTRQLAERIGVSHTSVSHCESGKHILRPETIHKYVQGLYEPNYEVVTDKHVYRFNSKSDAQLHASRLLSTGVEYEGPHPTREPVNMKRRKDGSFVHIRFTERRFGVVPTKEMPTSTWEKAFKEALDEVEK